MCDAGMPHQLLTLGYVALADDTHPLHPPFRAMFERLAAQALTPRDLRLLISSILLVVTFSVICCICMYALSKKLFCFQTQHCSSKKKLYKIFILILKL